MGLAVAGCGNGGTGVGHDCTNGRQWTGAEMGDGTGTHAASQAEQGHGTIVETAALRQGATTAHGKGGWGGGGGGGGKNGMKMNAPPPLFINQLDN